jgi:cyclopropane-fatty-acyl-phospholipid synthase
MTPEFYGLWLDELRVYSCGYWPEGTATLEEAQRNKIEHVCRKIALRAGERFIDIGCGFGGVLMHAARTTGATGVGVNTTHSQVIWLRGEIERRGLNGSVSVIESDLRDSDRRTSRFDKLVSIGVLEHAGRRHLAQAIRAHADWLNPGGLGMLHFIGHQGRRETELFIRKYIFPGGWIPALSDVVQEMERVGLEVLDIENLRRHYALTLDEWARRMQANWPRIQALDPGRFTERLRRIWQTYLVGCAETFRNPKGVTHLFQVTYSKGNVTPGGYPMGRGFLYR